MDHLLATGTEVTVEAVEALLEELVGDVTFVRAQLVRGLEAPADPIAVNDSLYVLAADPESLREVAAGLFDAEFVTAPRDADGLLVLVSSAEREGSGHLAPSLAYGMSAVILRQLAQALWLATGVEPRPVADWYAEQARLPSMGSPSRTLADLSDRGASLPPWAPESIVPERVRGAFQASVAAAQAPHPPSNSPANAASPSPRVGSGSRPLPTTVQEGVGLMPYERYCPNCGQTVVCREEARTLAVATDRRVRTDRRVITLFCSVCDRRLGRIYPTL